MKLPSYPRKGFPVEKTMREVIDYLRSITINNVVGGRACRSTGGTTLEFKPGGQPASSTQIEGAFWTRYTDEAGDTYLQCGTINGGNGGSESIADEKVLDSETGPGTNADKILYIQANCTATVEDGIMLPGCLLNSATLGTVAIGTGISANHTFTAASPTGNIYLEIGRWNDTTFLPAGPPGNLLASGCIGSFSITKVT